MDINLIYLKITVFAIASAAAATAAAAAVDDDNSSMALKMFTMR